MKLYKLVNSRSLLSQKLNYDIWNFCKIHPFKLTKGLFYFFTKFYKQPKIFIRFATVYEKAQFYLRKVFRKKQTYFTNIGLIKKRILFFFNINSYKVLNIFFLEAIFFFKKYFFKNFRYGFYSYFESRLDIFIWRLNFVEHLRDSNKFIKEGFIFVNFCLIINSFYIILLGDIVSIKNYYFILYKLYCKIYNIYVLKGKRFFKYLFFKYYKIFLYKRVLLNYFLKKIPLYIMLKKRFYSLGILNSKMELFLKNNYFFLFFKSLKYWYKLNLRLKNIFLIFYKFNSKAYLYKYSNNYKFIKYNKSYYNFFLNLNNFFQFNRFGKKIKFNLFLILLNKFSLNYFYIFKSFYFLFFFYQYYYSIAIKIYKLLLYKFFLKCKNLYKFLFVYFKNIKFVYLHILKLYQIRNNYYFFFSQVLQIKQWNFKICIDIVSYILKNFNDSINIRNLISFNLIYLFLYFFDFIIYLQKINYFLFQIKGCYFFFEWYLKWFNILISNNIYLKNFNFYNFFNNQNKFYRNIIYFNIFSNSFIIYLFNYLFFRSFLNNLLYNKLFLRGSSIYNKTKYGVIKVLNFNITFYKIIRKFKKSGKNFRMVKYKFFYWSKYLLKNSLMKKYKRISYKYRKIYFYKFYNFLRLLKVKKFIKIKNALLNLKYLILIYCKIFNKKRYKIRNLLKIRYSVFFWFKEFYKRYKFPDIYYRKFLKNGKKIFQNKVHRFSKTVWKTNKLIYWKESLEEYLLKIKKIYRIRFLFKFYSLKDRLFFFFRYIFNVKKQYKKKILIEKKRKQNLEFKNEMKLMRKLVLNFIFCKYNLWFFTINLQKKYKNFEHLIRKFSNNYIHQFIYLIKKKKTKKKTNVICI